MNKRPSARTAVFLFSLALALAFLAVDSAARLDLLRNLYGLTVADQPLPRTDAQSPSGYAGGQHRLILPSANTDGYHWLLQTERMLAGDGLRIRETQVDNAPAGRAVHWSSAPRWWLATAAWVYQRFNSALTLPQAVEAVAPGAMTLAFVFFLLALAPLVYWRFGAFAGAVFALGWVTIHPLYETVQIGSLDHHGLVAMAVVCSVLFPLAGGAGWVRDAGNNPSQSDSLWQWLLDAQTARRWFIASAVAAGIGLWLSASTIAPVIAGIAVGAVAAAAPARAAPGSMPLEPRLWRVWGVAGCLTSLGCYLLEYFPAHMQLRLEVNHPLYAIAWLALGDLLCRLLQSEPRAKQTPWLIADVLALALLPAVMILAQDTTFRIADPFLWRLHSDYILEFQSLRRQLATINPWLIAQGTSLLPLSIMPMAALLWPTTLKGTSRSAWRAILLVMAGAGILFLHTILFLIMHRVLGLSSTIPAHVAALFIDAIVAGALFVWPARRATALPAVWQSLIMLALLPALVFLVLSLGQVRWLATACALLLAALAGAIAALTQTHDAATLRAPRRVIVTLVVLAFLPAPLFALLFPWRLGYPVVPDLPQVVARDVGQLLRTRRATQPAVVLSAPTATTWLTWFGGFKGLGTLYWENIAGLKSAVAIYAAASPEEAKRLIDQHGITHIVVFSWEPFINEYTRLAGAPRESFLRKLIAGEINPDWLRPVPYELPDVAALKGASVRIFEVRRRTE